MRTYRCLVQARVGALAAWERSALRTFLWRGWVCPVEFRLDTDTLEFLRQELREEHTHFTGRLSLPRHLSVLVAHLKTRRIRINAHSGNDCDKQSWWVMKTRENCSDKQRRWVKGMACSRSPGRVKSSGPMSSRNSTGHANLWRGTHAAGWSFP